MKGIGFASAMVTIVTWLPIPILTESDKKCRSKLTKKGTMADLVSRGMSSSLELLPISLKSGVSATYFVLGGSIFNMTWWPLPTRSMGYSQMTAAYGIRLLFGKE
jgi:hypothetical protein